MKMISGITLCLCLMVMAMQPEEARREKVKSYGKIRTLGLTAEFLKGLVYELNEIPGREPWPERLPWDAPLGRKRAHTQITLDYGGDRPNGSLCSYIGRAWESRPIIDIWVFEDPQKARSWWHESFFHSSRRFAPNSYMGLLIGDECVHGGGVADILEFRKGRVVVSIKGSGDPEEIDAFGLGIEYRLLLAGVVLGFKDYETLTVGGRQVQPPVVSYRGHIIGPLKVLKTIGARTEYIKDARNRIEGASINLGERWIKVKAFSWDMETEKGKVKLERPVFPYKGELIVPLRQVAEALGIAVQQKGQTIALLTK